MKIENTFSALDVLYYGHIKMLEDAKCRYDYLICATQTHPTKDLLEKNRPIRSLIEHYIQSEVCKCVEGIEHYGTE
tara:strand:+ start:25 stop:252 length:228 start_codon:yes stop_codon:yes gene_type:complete